MAKGWKVQEDERGSFHVVNEFGRTSLGSGWRDREKAEQRMAQLKNRPGYRKPWTHGVAAYTEADTFEDLVAGAKGTRKEIMLHMPNGGPAGEKKCAGCGELLKDPYHVNPGDDKTRVDTYSTWHYSNKTKKAYGMHYYCSWGALMDRLFEMHDLGLI